LFMIRLTLRDSNHKQVLNVAKPTGLKYKSTALRAVFLLLYWSLYITGFAEETQHISVDLINDFIEGSYPGVGPTTEAIIGFEARDIQIYPPTVLRISAALTGLRYYMYVWRLTSFAVGTTTLCFFLYVFTLIGFTKWYRNENNVDHDDNDGYDGNDDHFMIEDNKQELKDLINNGNNGFDDENDENTEENKRHSNDENVYEEPLIGDLNESGLTGDLSANESEASSTVVIPETEEIDDSQPTPDSSSADT